jgi:ribosomal protein L17
LNKVGNDEENKQELNSSETSCAGGAIRSELGTAYIKFVPEYLLSKLANTKKKAKKLSKIVKKLTKNVKKKLSKSCQKVVKSCQSCQKIVKNFVTHLEKTQWCNSRKVRWCNS